MKFVDPSDIRSELGFKDHDFIEEVGIFSLGYLLNFLSKPILHTLF